MYITEGLIHHKTKSIIIAEDTSEAYCLPLTVSIVSCGDVEDVAGSLYGLCIAFISAVTAPLKKGVPQ